MLWLPLRMLHTTTIPFIIGVHVLSVFPGCLSRLSLITVIIYTYLAASLLHEQCRLYENLTACSYCIQLQHQKHMEWPMTNNNNNISISGKLKAQLTSVGLAHNQPTFMNWFMQIYLLPYPNCLQTTVASVLSHKSSHTVPHWSLMHTSTLPSYWLEPPTRRTSPYVQLWVTLTAVWQKV